MKKNVKELLIALALFIIAFLICMQNELNIFSKLLVANTDSNVFNYIGWSMTKGYIPYLDLFDHKGLLLYFINYIGALIAPIKGIWLIELCLLTVAVVFAYKLARKFTNKGVSLFITIIAFSPIISWYEGGNLTEEYALPFQLIALNIFFDFFLNPKKYSSTEIAKEKKLPFRLNFKWFNIPVFICGICFAAVLFLRPNMISIWIVFSIMVLIYCIAKKKYKELIKFIISFVCGILLLTIPMIIYLVVNGALGSFIDQYILFNMNYAATNEESRMKTFVTFLANTVTLLAFIIMIMKIYNEYKEKKSCYFDIGYFIYMVVTLLLISMGGRIAQHYEMTIIPMLIYPYCVLYKYLSKSEVKNAGTNLMVTGYILISIVMSSALTSIVICSQYIAGTRGNGNMNKEDYKIVNYVIENTEYNDLISVFGNANHIYLLTQRQSASKYSYQFPIATVNEKIAEEYINDIKTNQPPIIVFDVNATESLIKQKMKELLKENYTLVLDGEMEVYKIK